VKKFSIVELAIAFILVVIGIVGIIGLIPPPPEIVMEEPKKTMEDVKVGEHFCVGVQSHRATRIINDYLSEGWVVRNMSASKSYVFIVFEKTDKW
jgi:hypothetical protein